jgi:hypothetical protein
MATLRATLTTTMWVIDGIHCGSSNLWTTTQPARTTSLTDGLVLMLNIPNLSNRSVTVLVDLSKFAGRQSKQDEFAFLRHYLSV